MLVREVGAGEVVEGEIHSLLLCARPLYRLPSSRELRESLPTVRRLDVTRTRAPCRMLLQCYRPVVRSKHGSHES